MLSWCLKLCTLAGTGIQCSLGDIDVQALNDKLASLDNQLREKNREISVLKEGNAKLKSHIFGIKLVKRSANKVKFFTGIPTLPIFLWTVSLLKDVKKSCSEDHLLIVLMRLRVGLIKRDIANRYCCKPTIISTIFRRWLPAVSVRLKN